MRLYRLTCLSFAFLLIFFFLNSEGRGGGGWITYKGAWFEIKYPSGFTVKTGKKSTTNLVGYDSVYFISPNNNVEFYVFSPQWKGEAKEIEINSNTEQLIDQNTKQEKNNFGQLKKIRMFTAKAKDNSYFRAIRDETTDSTRLIFGIKYKNKEMHNKYYNDYILFKKSLVQFAD